MELILDTNDVKGIRDLNELLSISGVTTNPTIVTKSHKKPEQLIAEIISELNDDQKLFVQAVSTDYEGIMKEAREIAALRKNNSYVKIPVTHEGLKAIKQAKKEGIGVLATAIYTPDQAFLAAMNGADYLAPYVNRMDDYGDGVAAVKDLIEMLKVHNLPAKVVAASFKNTRQVHELIKAGIQAVTVPTDVVYKMIDHPGTEIAVEEFTENWQKEYGRNTLFEEQDQQAE